PLLVREYRFLDLVGGLASHREVIGGTPDHIRRIIAGHLAQSLVRVDHQAVFGDRDPIEGMVKQAFEDLGRKWRIGLQTTHGRRPLYAAHCRIARGKSSNSWTFKINSHKTAGAAPAFQGNRARVDSSDV